MEYGDLKHLFAHICEIKLFVVQLSMKDLKVYKTAFFRQNMQEWCLNLIWEYIWSDKDYETVETIFKNAKLI